MPKILALLCALSLSGCATLERHPYATGFAVAIVAGSIAASTQHDNRVSPHATSSIGTPSCVNGSCQ